MNEKHVEKEIVTIEGLLADREEKDPAIISFEQQEERFKLEMERKRKQRPCPFDGDKAGWLKYSKGEW